VELRPKEDDPEEQCQNADALSLGLHVLTKTKLRPEWLQGQGLGVVECSPLATNVTEGRSNMAR